MLPLMGINPTRLPLLEKLSVSASTRYLAGHPGERERGGGETSEAENTFRSPGSYPICGILICVIPCLPISAVS